MKLGKYGYVKELIFESIIIVCLVCLMMIMKGDDFMAHNKTYVVCENMCLEEGMTKKQINERFAAITGSITINNAASAYVDIDYPTDFTVDNSIVIGQMIKGIGGNNFKSGIGYTSNNTVNLSPTITLLNDKIRVQVFVYNTVTQTYDYKIMLMKMD